MPDLREDLRTYFDAVADAVETQAIIASTAAGSTEPEHRGWRAAATSVRSSSFRSAVAAFVLVALAATGVWGAVLIFDDDTTTTARGPVRPDASSPTRAIERTAAIYSAVIRQLFTIDGGYAGNVGAIYVLNGVLKDAGQPGHLLDSRPPEPFARAVRRSLRREVRDLVPLHFVNELADVLPGEPDDPSEHCRADPIACEVINGGVLVSLGPVTGSGSRVEVGVDGWRNLQSGVWLTFAVERRATGWAVVGPVGAISTS